MNGSSSNQDLTQEQVSSQKQNENLQKNKSFNYFIISFGIGIVIFIVLTIILVLRRNTQNTINPQTDFQLNTIISPTETPIISSSISLSPTKILAPTLGQINPSLSPTPTSTTSATNSAQFTNGISGTIITTNNIPPNSYFTLGVKNATSSSFSQVLTNITASSSANWYWGNATNGATYDIQAYLWVNNTPYSQSNILTVKAPSGNNQLSINTKQTLAGPDTSTINVSCNGQQSGQFQATINYNTLSSLLNVAQYRVVIVLAADGTQVFNTILSPSSPNVPQSLTTTYVFVPGATYTAQYAYTKTTNLTQFSDLSAPVQFSCR